MFSSVCRTNSSSQTTLAGVDATHVFVKETSNFKLDSINQHETSKYHWAACLKKKIKQLPVTDAPAEKTFSVLTSLHQKRMKILIR